MNPYMLHKLAAQHGDELRADAGRARPHVTPPRPRGSVRQRAGWGLVEIGLRLAGGPDEA
jgi:hypothetical protein